MSITLKYPPGEFTQAELAAFNGLEKLAVYLPMKEAIAKGILNFSGTRATGKRPANVYQVSSKGQATSNTELSVPVPVPTLVPTQPAMVETPPVTLVPQSIVEITPIPSTPPSAVIAPALEAALPPRLAPNPAYPCPLCKGPMTEIPDATGVIVKCFNVPCDPQCNENVYGHGKNAKEAYDVAKQKFIMP